MAKISKRQRGLAKILKAKKIKPRVSKSRVDNSIINKFCPFFRSKCKGLACAFGDSKKDYSIWGGSNKEVLFCKLFEGLTGNLKFNIETSIKQDED